MIIIYSQNWEDFIAFCFLNGIQYAEPVFSWKHASVPCFPIYPMSAATVEEY